MTDFNAALRVFGFIRINKKVVAYSITGLVLGCLLAILNNFLREEYLLPPLLTWFAFIAPIIGITEELVFRGYVQSKLASMGAILSIVFASAGHTLYKFIVVSTVPGGIPVNYASLIILTFAVGMVFGLFRYRSGSILPAVLAHAVFDIVIYGGESVAPVWVWG